MGKYDASIEKFLTFCNAGGRGPDLEGLKELLAAFAQVPYENLSKIIAVGSTRADAFRTPERVVADHLEHRLGGTCFSLVYLFKALLDYLGFSSHLVLADRAYGTDTHCALFVMCAGSVYLADPGYLVFTPVPLPEGASQQFRSGPYRLRITPVEGGRAFDIHSLSDSGHEKFRYRIKSSAADEGTFFDAWKASFEFEMMDHIVINTYRDGRHIYLRDSMLHETGGAVRLRKRLTGQEFFQVLARLGMAPEMARHALSLTGGLPAPPMP
ncbi:MAG: arylamine N-acetyltransferase [Candidatus Eremiobacteraeota bacterium]|nr:arylamine N-acetyltransferase [Candidatus Eremiobacteraeota bacterium]